MVTETYETRTKCPFYGFAYRSGIFMDTEGNQCALLTTNHSPCKMEMAQQEVCWGRCGFNRRESASTIEKLLKSAIIFPSELMPEGVPSWRGIPLRKWYKHIVNGEKI